jgi:hypothetical protein
MDKATWNLGKILSSSHGFILIVPMDPPYDPSKHSEKVGPICHRLVAVPIKNHFKTIKESSCRYLAILSTLPPETQAWHRKSPSWHR